MKIIPPGQPTDTYLRILVFGDYNSGKTSFAATFPAPLLIHCVTEGGYKTFETGQGNLFPVAPVGETHSAWVAGLQGAVRVSEDVSTNSQNIQRMAFNGTLPYQTIVIGGFSIIHGLVVSEAEKIHSGERNNFAKWGYLLNWITRIIQDFFNHPCNGIIEANLKEKRGDNGRVLGLMPDIDGKGCGRLLNAVDFGVYMQQINPGQFTGQIHQTGDVKTKKRFALALADHCSQVQNMSYDFFVEWLGLPNVMEADPNHPRCQPGVWPYKGHCHM
jgi:hypothetical protein